MPELPEVEVVRAGLHPAVDGAVVTGVEVLDERSLRRHPGPSEDFAHRLTGATLLAPERRGKFLWIPLDPASAPLAPSEMQESPTPPATAPRESPGIPAPDRSRAPGTPAFRKVAVAGGGGEVDAGVALVVHLGMSGQVLLRTADAPRDRLTRIVLDIEHPGRGALRVDFVDQRIFGSMALDDLLPAADHPEQRIPSQVAHIARDPIDPMFDDARFLAALRRRRTTVKRALLDQSLVSGIGNIYADEALWAARIHYDQPTATLSRPRAVRLLAEVRQVLGRALLEGGTSFDALYVDVNGASGYFSRSLNVYGRQGLPCPRCGRPIVRETFMNRGSHFCPFCQRVRAPRS